MSWFQSCGLIVSLFFLAMPALAQDASPDAAAERRLFYYGAWVELSADGRVVDATLPQDTTVPAVLREPLVQNLEAMAFEPARPDGVAKPSRSWLQGTLELLPKGDNYELVIEADQLGPRLLQPFHPRTGRPPDEPVRMLLEFEVTAEGRVRDVQATAFDRAPSGMSKKVTDSVRALRFEPEQVDGKPVATQLRWPFQARRNMSAEKPFELPPLARAPQRPGVPGQDAYALPVAITAELRGSISIPVQ